MFYDPELMREIYSKYLNGLSIDDITYYFNWFRYVLIKEDEVEEIIDVMNRLL